MKNIINNESASSFMWLMGLLISFVFALFYTIFNDCLKPMYEYSLEVNPDDPMRDFFADTFNILPIIFFFTIVLVVISKSHREGDSN